MAALILIETLKNGIQTRVNLMQLQTLTVTSGATYQLIDNDTQQPVENLALKRDGDELHVEVDGEPVARIEDFFVSTNEASFIIDDGGAGLLTLPSSEMFANDEGVVWEASGNKMGLGGALVYGAAIGGVAYGFEEYNGKNEAGPSYNISFGAAAGELQSVASIIVYDENGNIIATEEHDFSAGPFVLSVNNGYVGPILVRIVDLNDTDGDYIDETSNQLTSLGGDLRAMAFADGVNDVEVNITPLTELAVRQAGITDNNQVSEDDLSVNETIGELFGVDNIIGAITTVTADEYDDSDGLNDAEIYGNVLAALSGVDSDTGSIDASLTLLTDNIETDNNGQLSFTQDAVDTLTSGVDNFASGVNANLANLDDTLGALDSDAPTVESFSTNASSGTFKAGDTIEITATLSEAVQAGDSIIVTLATGETVTLIAGSDGTTLTGNYTISEGVSGTDLSVSSYSVVSLTDNAGNSSTSTDLPDTNIDTGTDIVIDGTAPTVAITLAATALAAGETTTVTFTFSETPTEFALADITAQNGTLSTFAVSGSDDKVYTATFTPNTNIEDTTNIISVSTGYTDAAGNTGTAADSANYSIDTQAPNVAITLASSVLAVGETTTVTFTFSETPTVFALADITAQNGTLSAFSVSGSDDKVYTATFIPTANIEDATNVISVNASYADAVGNTGTANGSANYTIDTQAPSVAISLADSALIAGETTTVTFTFSETPTDFALEDVSAANGILSAFAVSGSDDKVYTATFTPNTNIEDTTNIISVGTAYTDAVGNTGTAADSTNYTVDTQAPSVVIALASSALAAGETTTVTFTFSEAPTDFAAEDVSVENGTLSAFTVTADDKVYAATFTPNTNIEDTTNVISVNTAYTDAAGNTGTAANSANYTIDTQAPSLAITLADTALVVGETTTVTFTFSETPTDFALADVTAQNGVLSAFAVSGSDDKVYTATFTPTANIEDTTNVISVSTAYTDAAGNTGTAADSVNYSIDTQAPTVVVTLASSALAAGETTTVTFTFSETPTDFTATDVSVENGTLSAFTVSSSDDKVYTATFTPNVNIEDATNIISVNTAYTDAAGNTGTAADSANYTIDTQAPTVAITLADTALAAGETTTVTFTFSETPSDFSLADITAENGILSAFAVSGSDDKVYTATFTPNTNIEDATNVISVNTAYTDAAGNTGTVGASANYTVDTQAPSVAITLASSALAAGETTTATFTFSETPTDFALEDVSAANGTLSAFAVSGSDDKVYTATFTPSENIEDTTNVISVNTAYTDAAGNTGTAANSANYTVETLAPTVVITLADTDLIIGETTTVTFTFSETPSGFAAEDVSVENGVLSAFTATVDDKVYTATFTPSANIEDATNIISVNTGYTDAAGNTGTAANSANYTVETQAPNVAITLASSALAAGETTTVTFTFSETPTDFALADVTAQNGVLSAFAVSGSDDKVYTATFTPNTNIEDTTNIINVGSGYTDAAGNTGTVVNSANYSIDTQAPSVAITLASGALAAGESTTVTFTFSETPTDFTATDVSVENGTLSAFAVNGSDDKVYTATFTPAVNIEDATNVISVNTAYTDAAGNTGTAADSANYTVETLAPTVAITLADTDLIIGETTTVTFTFSETPSGFTAEDVSVENGTLNAFTVTADDKVYTATFTPTANIEDASNVISVNTAYTDAAGNSGTAADSANYTIDTQAPSVAITLASSALAAGETTTVTFIFSETPSGFAAEDVSVENGVLSAFTVTADDKVYTATFTPSANIEDTANVISVNTAYTDAAGNTGAAGDSANYSIDTQAPSVAITLANTDLIVGETTTVTFTFSETPTDFAAEDVSVENGVLSAFTVTADDKVYTATFTPNTNIEDATNVISVNTAYTDAAGNTGTAGGSANYSIDTQAPSVVITLADTDLIVGETTTVTFTFSETPSDFAVGDVTVANGVLSAFTVTADDKVYTATFTPNANIEDTTNVISVNTAYTDAAGNTGTAADSANYTVDTQAPIVAITLADTDLIVGETTSVTFTFSETPTDFTAEDVSVENGTLSAFAVSGSDDKVYTATFTPTANIEDATNVISVNTAYTDAAGNTGNTGGSANYTVDTQAPNVVIALASSALAAGETTTVTFTFSETPTGFAAEDVTVANGTLSAFAVSGSDDKVYTATFTPNTNIEDTTNVISVNTAYTDAAGNTGTAADSTNYTIDTQAPSVAITLASSALAAGETTTVTFTFNETPTDFALEDITAANGTLSAFTVSGSDDKVYTATFTSNVNIEDTTNVISVSTAYTDAAGNTGTAGDSANYTVDTQAPTVAITLADSALAIGETTTVTFIFSETPTDFAAEDVTVANGVLSAFTVTADDKVYTATFTPNANIEDATNVISVNTAYTDAAGNTGTAADSANYAIDTQAPTVAITLADTDLIVGETTTVTFTFSETPTDFTAEDVSVESGTLSAFAVSGSDDKVYTATFTPNTNIEDTTNVISVNTAYTDAAGNTGTAGDSANYTIDTQAPTVAITLVDSALAAGETTTVTFAFSETPTDFAAEDITVANGILSAFAVSGSDDKVYTATFTPTVNIEDTTNVISVSTAYADAVGNTGIAGDSANYTIDTQAPNVAITLADTDLIVGETTTVTFTFSETPTDFALEDVSVENGTLSAFSVNGSDDKVYTATFTPNANIEDASNVISVNTAYTDVAGNTGTAGDSANYTVETLAPTVAITLADTDLIIGETTTVTFTFSETPSDFAAEDVTVANGVLSAFNVTADDKVYTATFTPNANIDDATNVISVNTAYTDAAGNTGTTANSANYTIDTQAPSVAVTLASSALAIGETTTVTFTFSETPTDFSETDVAVANGVLSDFTVTVDDKVYTATFTPTDDIEDASNVISVGTGYTDAVDNTGTANTSANYTIDTKEPTLTSSTPADDASDVSLNADIVLTFNENIVLGSGDIVISDGTQTITIDVENHAGQLSVNDNVLTINPTDDLANNGVDYHVQVAETAIDDLNGNSYTGIVDTTSLNFRTESDASIVVFDLTIGTSSSHSSRTFDANVSYTIYIVVNTYSEQLQGIGDLWSGATNLGVDDRIVLVGTDAAVLPLGSFNLPVSQVNIGSSDTLTWNSASSYAAYLSTFGLFGRFANGSSNSSATLLWSGSGVIPPANFDFVLPAGIASTQGLIDTRNPLAPSIPDMSAASDNGSSDADNLTNDITPTFEGSAEVNSTITLTSSIDGVVGTATASAIGNGAWSITTSTLSAGSHNITATATDAAGNTSVVSATLAINIDTTQPTVAITLADASLIVGETTTVTFTFNETPTDFSVADVTVANGTLSGFAVTADDKVYTATFTPTDDIEDASNVISIGTVYTDAAGNTGTVGDSANYTIDTKEPTVAITLANTTLAVGETTTATFTFSETPADFAEADITVANGVLSDFTVTADDKVYTATFTPTDDIEDASNVISVGTAYTDAAGNTGTAGDSANYIIDTKEPTVAITLASTALAVAETTTVTFTFSETPTDFTEADISVANGNLSDFAITADDKVYTATFTPMDDIEDTSNVISVGTAYIDAAGNTGTAGDSANYTIDTKEPTVAITLDDTDLTEGETTTVTFTFSETPAGFSVDDVTADNGTLSAFTVTGDDKVYTATFTPANNITDPTNTISVSTAYTDGIGNTGAAGSSGNYSVDTPPSTSIIVFDFIGGGSSSHSNRTFDPNVSYDIYLRMDSTSVSLTFNGGDKWSNAEALGADDRIHFVGNGSPILGLVNNSVDGVFTATGNNTPIAQTFSAFAAGIRPIGQFQRLFNLTSGSVEIWSGAISQRLLPGAFGTTLPAGVLTSQGLS